MLSLREIERATAALRETRLGARLERVMMPAPDELVLDFGGGGEHAGGDRLRLLLSCRPGFARIAASPAGRKALPTPPALAQYLKAHVQGARLRDARVRGGDRQAELLLETREARFALMLSILGPRSNLYLLDGRDHLLVAARPLGETRRDLRAGAPFVDPEGRPPSEGEDRFASLEGEALLRGIEAAYAGAEAHADDGQLRRRMTKALGKALGAVDKKTARLRKDAEAGAKAPQLERMGELLKGSLDKVGRAATSVETVDFESGEPVTILLDPKKSAAENLEDYFRRARKAVRKEQKAEAEIGAQSARREELEALGRDLEAAESTDDLRALAETPAFERLLGRFAPAPAEPAAGGAAKKVWKVGKRELPTRLVPKRYATESGLEVWVGKNDQGNDILTTRLARGRDLFFHLEGNPGSHVVLRVEGKGEPPQSAVLEAAELSVHFSKARTATRASVHVAAIRDISKPRDAKPGLVYVHRGRTIQLRRSADRLKRTLEARIDD